MPIHILNIGRAASESRSVSRLQAAIFRRVKPGRLWLVFFHGRERRGGSRCLSNQSLAHNQSSFPHTDKAACGAANHECTMCSCAPVSLHAEGRIPELLYSRNSFLKRQKCSYVFLREGESSCIPWNKYEVLHNSHFLANTTHIPQLEFPVETFPPDKDVQQKSPHFLDL